ncbi:two-component system sensor histidine kinase KdbD [Thiocystis minor]|uniref:two-component system sensor histidine kinase KdpD n=1 Tax=Thiocystis minor TaxID=61597 RepID=UPI001914D399|nr:two-component system sensor histidine kinase KdpD [Thiocystis minor]MBK5964980.1 two-component system sensor histidine kinase KdbD [Thiocystis minor]
MNDQRPDPDALLARIVAEEARAARGRLKVFFGASAGVGKTYAMLAAAHQQREQGVDVVVGLVETHGRRETEILLQGLECLPLKEVDYHGRRMRELDLDGALARHPALILVDELAHSNLAGSRHPKRWQDVHELLAAGIDVYTTLNVQHLETLNNIVGGITGIRVWETLPDHVFDAADEVVLVDLAPDELLQRLKEGKVYLPHQAARAIQNFFRKGNLIALRELALRRTADRVDRQMLEYRRDQSVSAVWQTRETVLACVGPGENAERVIRSAARIAARDDVPWHALYVETPALQRLPRRQRQRILARLRLAQELGAETATLSGADPVEVIVEYARGHNLFRILVGRDRVRAWRSWRQSVADRIARQGPDLEVILVAHEETRAPSPVKGGSDASWRERFKAPWSSYAMSLLICASTALLASPLHSVFELANIAMLFLLAIVVVAARYGLGPSVMAAFINVVAFDLLFVPPRFSLSVSDVQYLITFAVMLGVGLITAHLTTGMRYQARVASRRERRSRALYELARDLSGALLPQQIAEIGQRFAAAEFGARAVLILANEGAELGQQVLPAPADLPVDLGIGKWAFEHEAEAGCGTDTLPGSPLLYVPLKAPMRIRGVLAIEPRDPTDVMTPEQGRLLDTFARLIAIAVERVHYVEIAQTTTLKMESERLRNAFLSAISHDLRTPLTVLVGLADSLLIARPSLTPDQADIAAEIRDEARRMTTLANNLLDMARLRSGTVLLNRQWQPLEEVVGSALKALQSVLAHYRVSVDLPEDLPLLELDAMLMERLLVNLLDNAAKYTPSGTAIGIGAAMPSADQVEFWVEDAGPGLPSDKAEAVLQTLERGHEAQAMSGMGLGLSLCRAIVEAHGGTIRVQARGGGGARFVVTLPRGNPPTVDLLDEAAVSCESS